MKYLLFSIIPLLFTTVKAQDILKLVPTVSKSVILVNPSRFSEVKNQVLAENSGKIDEWKKDFLLRLSKGYLLSYTHEDLLALGLVGDDLGINTNASYACLNIENDTMKFSGAIYEIKGSIDSLKSAFIDEKNFNEMTYNSDHYSYYFKESIVLAWNTKHLVIGRYDNVYSYYNYGRYEEESTEEVPEDDYETYLDRYKDLQNTEERLAREKATLFPSQIYNLVEEHSLTDNLEFNDIYDSHNDIIFYFPGYTLKSVDQALFGFSRSRMTDYLSKLAGNYGIFNFNFEENHIAGNGIQMLNDYTYELVEDIPKKIDAKLIKSIDGKNAVALIGGGFNSKAAYEAFTTVYSDILSATNFGAVIDLYISLLDEEKITDLIKGDILFTLYRPKIMTTTYTTYEYDEDFNESQVTKTEEQLTPVFSFAMTTENKEISDKILKIFLQESSLVATENYYEFYSRGKRNEQETNSPDFYFKIEDDIFTLSNDIDIFKSPKKSKLPEKLSSAKKHEGLFMLMDMKNLEDFKLNKDVDLKMNKANDFYTEISKYAQSMSFYNTYDKNKIYSHFNLYTPDGQDLIETLNAIIQLTK